MENRTTAAGRIGNKYMFPAIKIGKEIDWNLHHFSDASQDEYG